MAPFRSPDAIAAPVVGRTLDLAGARIDDSLSDVLAREVWVRHVVMPLERTESTLTVAVAYPFVAKVVDDLTFLTGLCVRFVVGPAPAIHAAIHQLVC
jgi:hypothetical protein